MKLVDTSTRLRLSIFLIGVLVTMLLPSSYWQKVASCAVYMLLSVITTITALAQRDNSPVSRYKAILHVAASMYVSVIFVLTAINIVAVSPYRSILILFVFILLGVQAYMK